MSKTNLAPAAATLVLASCLGLLTWATLPGRRPDSRAIARGSKANKIQRLRASPTLPTREVSQRMIRAKAIPLLDAADRESQKAINEQLLSVDRFFAEAKKQIPPFTDRVLGFDSQWRLMVDQVPFLGGDRHHDFLKDAFDQSIISEERLQKEVQAVVDGYLQAERDIEDQLLVKLRRDLADLPEGIRIAALDQETIRAAIAQAVNDASAHATASLKVELSRELATMVIGELLTQALLRSVLRGTLACSGVLSWGVGLGACLAVNQALGWARDRWSDPKGRLTEAMTRRLDELRLLVVEGKPETPGLKARLRDMARKRSVLRRRVILDSILTTRGEN